MRTSYASVSETLAISAAAFSLAAVCFVHDLAAQSFEIAAVVNDEAISVFDVELRAALMAQTGEAPTRTAPERDALRAMALDELIDGVLKEQEAKRIGVEPTAAQVDDAVNAIAQSNGLTADQLRANLGGDQGLYASLRRRLRSDVAWAIAAPRLFAADFAVSESDLDAAEADADPALLSLERETKVTLRQIFVPVADGDPTALARARGLADEARAATRSCGDIDRVHLDLGIENLSDLGVMALDDLPHDIRRVVERLPVDQASRPIRLRTGFSVLFVCDRDFRSETAIDRDALAQRLRQQRFEALSARRLGDLRRIAVIDLR